MPVRTIDYPFEDAPNTATLTCRHIVEDNAPVLYVSHDEDDGMWQFLCGGNHVTEDAVIVSLKWIFEHAPSVGQLKDLPLGYFAERSSADGRWIIKKG